MAQLTVWKLRRNMPRIPLRLPDVIFYTYASKEDAEAGKRGGGTGFIVAYPIPEIPGASYAYLVTARHIIEGKKECWVRLNTIPSGVAIHNVPAHNWQCSDTSDVAIIRVGLDADHKFEGVNADTMFLTEDIVAQHQIGIGDDVFMLGRFALFDGGKDENVPVVRFGHVALMPERRIEVSTPEYRWTAPAYLVDMGTRHGFSGSPAFLFTDPNRLQFNEDGTVRQTGASLFSCIGLCSGVFPDRSPVYATGTDGKKYDTKRFTEGYSGMAVITPAKDIRALLDSQPVAAERVAQTKVELALLGDGGAVSTG